MPFGFTKEAGSVFGDCARGLPVNSQLPSFAVLAKRTIR